MVGKNNSKNKPLKVKLHDHFVEGNVSDLFGNLEDSLSKLTEGPQVKTQATYDYEYILKNILLKKKVVFSVKDDEYWVELENGKKFNVSEMLRNFEATHLGVGEEYHSGYVDFLKNSAVKKPQKDPDFTSYGEDMWATEEYFNKRDEAKELDNLSYAEKCAINIYTQDYYETMNEILRGNIFIKPDSDTFQNEMIEVMLHNAFSASGLNKVGNVEVDNAFRVDKNLPQELVKEKIKSIDKKKAVVSDKGFVSSSKDGPIPIAGQENPLFAGNMRKGMVFTVYGKLIGKNISALSSLSKEREILIPPNTQLKYKKHEEEDGAHYFYADVVRTPVANQKPGTAHELTAQELGLEKKMSGHRGSEIDPQEVEALINNIKNLKKDFHKEKFKFHTDPARKEQIAKLMLKANQLALDNKLTPTEKMVQITEALLNVENQIKAKQAKQSSFVKLFQSKSRLSKTINANLDTLSKASKKVYNTHQTKQNLFDYENPIFDERMKRILIHVHDNHLSKPYTETKLDPQGENEFVNKNTEEVVPRPNHATAHTVRGALVVPAVLENYKQADPKRFKDLGIDDIKRMQVAMLFSTVGRQSEVNVNYNKYRKDSTTAFHDYCKEHCKDLFNDKQLKEYTEYLKWYTDPSKTQKHPKAEIMRMCHSLDLLRCKNEDEFNAHCKNELVRKLGEGPAEALVSYSRQCLIATGNRIQSGEIKDQKPYKPTLFTECSLNPEKALEHLSKVAPPKDLSKPKFKSQM